MRLWLKHEPQKKKNYSRPIESSQNNKKITISLKFMQASALLKYYWCISEENVVSQHPEFSINSNGMQETRRSLERL